MVFGIIFNIMDRDQIDELFNAYPIEQRRFLKATLEAGLLTWSGDAAVKNNGRGYYIPAEKLVEFLSYFLGGE